jgi:hypothetical protein
MTEGLSGTKHPRLVEVVRKEDIYTNHYVQETTPESSKLDVVAREQILREST